MIRSSGEFNTKQPAATLSLLSYCPAQLLVASPLHPFPLLTRKYFFCAFWQAGPVKSVPAGCASGWDAAGAGALKSLCQAPALVGGYFN